MTSKITADSLWFWTAAFFQEPICVRSGHFGKSRIHVAIGALALIVMAVAILSGAQSPEPAASAIVQGHVRDSNHVPVANALVVLQAVTGTQTASAPIQTTHTDSEGLYRFVGLADGSYSLRVEMRGYAPANFGPLTVARTNKETTIDLTLSVSSTSEKTGTKALEFFDEPQFTVAGVTQATNSGGHGSDTVLRTTEALAKATVSLSKDSDGNSERSPSAAAESALRDTLKREPDTFAANRDLGKLLADNGKATEALPYLDHASRLSPRDPEVHHLRGDVEEKLSNPLEAVREYQRAAELDPSELNLFDWGTELLIHRALEPATEVFAKGSRLFPKSVRMLVALGVAWYARGSYDQAVQCLVNASDLAPANPTPYLFLGRMQNLETTPSAASAERLQRFAQMEPDNALANYYSAVSLWKQSPDSRDDKRSERVEALLQKAVRQDPKLGTAYLQLGILYSGRADFAHAIRAFQRAIEVSSEETIPQPDETLEEAHYRMAQAYLRIGDKTKAKEQLQLHDQLAKKTTDKAERERRDIQQFVISLQNKNSVPPSQN
jgi:tetratricopeptide (TPR) repeat protein